MALGNRPLYWFAESLDEASLPKGMDVNVTERFHALMGRMIHEMQPDLRTAFETGNLDALVLSAALGERACAILTLCDGDGCPPLLAQSATEIGVKTHRLDPFTIRRVRQGWLHPLLMRAGLLGLVAGGVLKLAYLRLTAPFALFSEESRDDDLHPSVGWLTDSHLFWGTVACCGAARHRHLHPCG